MALWDQLNIRGGVPEGIQAEDFLTVDDGLPMGEDDLCPLAHQGTCANNIHRVYCDTCDKYALHVGLCINSIFRCYHTRCLFGKDEPYPEEDPFDCCIIQQALQNATDMEFEGIQSHDEAGPSGTNSIPITFLMEEETSQKEDQEYAEMQLEFL